MHASGKERWHFMQDGASRHTAKKTMEFLHPLCLTLPGWPRTVQT
jgi:hypothetical protein